MRWTQLSRASSIALYASSIVLYGGGHSWIGKRCNSELRRVNYFTQMCRGSRAGSYLRLIDFFITFSSTLGLMVRFRKRTFAMRGTPTSTGGAPPALFDPLTCFNRQRLKRDLRCALIRPPRGGDDTAAVSFCWNGGGGNRCALLLPQGGGGRFDRWQASRALRATHLLYLRILEYNR